MSRDAYIAVDLGAESGRVMTGVLEAGRLDLHEAHRFRHTAAPTPVGLCWDVTGLWRHILDGLAAAAGFLENAGISPRSVGVDTWGVDWTLLSSDGEVLGLPRCYRDPAFERAFEEVAASVSPRRVYDATGVQLLPFNTLYQYHARARRSPGLFEQARTIQFMPDLFHFWLSGETAVERTIASTSQMTDVRTGEWNRAFLSELGLPTGPLPPLTPPGTAIGTLRPDVVAATGLGDAVRVVLPPSHDTASAVAATPADEARPWCYLSSGTWSLLGAELRTPCVTEAAARANFTNELGVDGTVRFLKNLAGLWLVQEVRRDLEGQAGKTWDYGELTRQAAAAAPMRMLIPVNDPAFARPGGAVARLRGYATATGQPVPETPGALVRCCLESLALEYRATLTTLETLLDRSFAVLHVLGGGGRNGLLNQMTADATGKRVVAGPVEATAMGNVLTQAMGAGHVPDLAAARDIVRDSAAVQTFDPASDDAWKDAAARYAALPAVGVSRDV